MAQKTNIQLEFGWLMAMTMAVYKSIGEKRQIEKENERGGTGSLDEWLVEQIKCEIFQFHSNTFQN